MQTVTLHADMTRIDLSRAGACCHRDQMMKYLDMGLTTEEVVELSLKLAALQALGIHLKIEGGQASTELIGLEGIAICELQCNGNM